VHPGREEVLARERRWSLPVALATFSGVALLIGSAVAINSIGGGESAEVLRLVYRHGGDVTLSTVLEAAGFVLLAAPLVYLFRAAQARSERVRGQLVGVVLAAPLFLAVAAGLNAVATTNAASEFVAGKPAASLSRRDASGECRSDRSEKGVKAFREEFRAGAGGPTALGRCIERKVSNDRAENAITHASPRGLGTGFGLAGRLGLAFAFVYSCLWAMRTGLLSRFWGSLGIALGVAALLLLIQFTLIWFLYFGLLAAGWVPGGRPPAWAAGEAIPWPTPGERAAGTLGGDGAEPPIEAEASEVPAAELPQGGERRKRKRRG
jgi:hypothetical protein